MSTEYFLIIKIIAADAQRFDLDYASGVYMKLTEQLALSLLTVHLSVCCTGSDRSN